MSKLAYFADRITDHRAVTTEGYLWALGVPIARTGYQNYRAGELKLEGVDANKIVSVYRDEAEVFSPSTMASFESKPVTSPHPPDFLNADNVQQYALGTVRNVRRGPTLPTGDHSLIADLLIMDKGLVMKVDHNILAETSCGYDYQLEPIEDEHSPDLKFAMTQIRGNHVAVVPNGRAGSHVRILDSNLAEEEGSMDVKGVREFYNEAKEIFLSLGWTAPKQATDAESEAVERNKEHAKESLKLGERTVDEDKTEKKEAKDMKGKDEEKDEKEMKDKKVKDAEEKEEKEAKDAEEKQEKKEASDAALARDKRLDRIADALEKFVAKATDAACTCDADEDEDHAKSCPMFKGAEDADLIPTETVAKEDRPKNPIPGADAAPTLEVLRSLKTVIAQTGDKKLIDSVNAEYRRLKGIRQGGTGDGYKEFGTRGEKASEKAREQATDGEEPRRANDEDRAANFADISKQYLGKNPGEVKISEGGK